MSKIILVTGGTGRQGRALIKSLLAAPNASTFKIYVLSRNPHSSTAIKLKEQGIEIIQGDFNNIPAIFKNQDLMKQPLWGIFSVQV
jgi:uncharacterized protein YbjT (DUF2867 family)